MPRQRTNFDLNSTTTLRLKIPLKLKLDKFKVKSQSDHRLLESLLRIIRSLNSSLDTLDDKSLSPVVSFLLNTLTEDEQLIFKRITGVEK